MYQPDIKELFCFPFCDLKGILFQLSPHGKVSETSTKKPFVIDGDIIMAGQPMSFRPCLPEPQMDPYWLAKREGNIRTCNGCLKKYWVLTSLAE